MDANGTAGGGRSGPPRSRRWVVALGSNVADPAGAVGLGWRAACAILGLRRARLSALHASDPAEGAGGGRFCNAVGVGWTDLDPVEGLTRLQRVERAFGRDRRREGVRGARPLDLDLIDIAGVAIDSAELTLPHPRFAKRRFVVAPLAEVCPRFRDPRSGRSVRALLAALCIAVAIGSGACRHQREPPVTVHPPGAVVAPPAQLPTVSLDDPAQTDALVARMLKDTGEEATMAALFETAHTFDLPRLAGSAGARRWSMWAVWFAARSPGFSEVFPRVRALVDALQAAAPKAPETLACRSILRILVLTGGSGAWSDAGVGRAMVADLRTDLALLAADATFVGAGDFDRKAVAEALAKAEALLAVPAADPTPAAAAPAGAPTGVE